MRAMPDKYEILSVYLILKPAGGEDADCAGAGDCSAAHRLCSIARS